MTVYNTTLAVDRTWENIKEDTTYVGKQGLLGSAAIATGYGLIKYAPAKDMFTKTLDASVNGSGNFISKIMPKAKPYIDKALGVFNKIPKSAKIAGVLAAVGGLIMHNISTNHNYKKGQINQKYNMLEKQQEIMMG